MKSNSTAQAYLDGELCGVCPEGITSFNMIQGVSDDGNAAGLVYFIFDLLHLDGENLGALPLIERKARLAELLSGVAPPLHCSDYHLGRGPAFHEQACKPELEGIVSKRADAAYAPGNRGIWLKVKMPLPRGICRGRLDPSRRTAAVPRRLVARLLRSGRQAGLAAPAPASTPPSSSGYGDGCGRSRLKRCRSTCRRCAAAVSDRRSGSAGCIGCGRSWSPN